MHWKNNLPFALAVAGFICLSAIAPGLFAAIIGISVIVIVVAFILGGFVFALDHWDVRWPFGVLIGVLLIGLAWPPALGLIMGVGAVGGLFMLVYVAIKESGR